MYRQHDFLLNQTESNQMYVENYKPISFLYEAIRLFERAHGSDS